MGVCVFPINSCPRRLMPRGRRGRAPGGSGRSPPNPHPRPLSAAQGAPLSPRLRPGRLLTPDDRGVSARGGPRSVPTWRAAGEAPAGPLGAPAQRPGPGRRRGSPLPAGAAPAAAQHPACARRDCRCQALPGERSCGGAVSFRLTFRFVAVQCGSPKAPPPRPPPFPGR